MPLFISLLCQPRFPQEWNLQVHISCVSAKVPSRLEPSSSYLSCVSQGSFKSGTFKFIYLLCQSRFLQEWNLQVHISLVSVKVPSRLEPSSSYILCVSQGSLKTGTFKLIYLLCQPRFLQDWNLQVHISLVSAKVPSRVEPSS